jgi:hypothetical protein
MGIALLALTRSLRANRRRSRSAGSALALLDTRFVNENEATGADALAAGETPAVPELAVPESALRLSQGG